MYIFYDTETSGLDRDFSQVLQIALVFTDDDLNILSSKKVDCRRSPWVVPSPGALLTTGFTPDDLKNSKNSAFEMMQEVDQWVRSQYWPVIFSGYNTLGYDEPVLAQNLHQNLLDPGLTEAKNTTSGERNSRFDIMTVVQAVQAYMPGALKLDIKNDAGHPSVKLGNVAEQNGVSLGAEDAHDALNDTKATVGVAKVVKKVAPAVWDQMHKLATRDGVDDFLAKNKIFTHTKYDFGKMNPVVAASITPRGGKTEILFDLSLDPSPYLVMTADQLKDVLIAQDKRQPKGAPPVPHPFRAVRKDLQPILMPLDLSDPVLPAKFDEKLAEARADAIKGNAAFQKNLLEAMQKVQDLQPQVTARVRQPEEMIEDYPDVSMRPKLHQWMQEFRDAPSWKAAADLVQDFYKRFEDELEQDPSIRRFVKFAGRIVFEHAPEELSEQKQQQMKAYLAAHILNPDTDVPWMTVAKAREEIEKIEKERAKGKAKWDEVTDTQIRSLKLYYTSIEKEYTPYITHLPKNDNAKPAAPSLDGSGPHPSLPPVPHHPELPPENKPEIKKAANDGPKP